MNNKNITIFSIGVNLQAVECVINNIKQWRWVAVNFEDETFLNGESVNPIEYAEKQRDLVEKFKND